MVRVWLLALLLTHCGLNQWCQKHEWLWLELNLSHPGWSLILWNLRRGKISSTHTTGPSCSRTCRALTNVNLLSSNPCIAEQNKQTANWYRGGWTVYGTGMPFKRNEMCLTVSVWLQYYMCFADEFMRTRWSQLHCGLIEISPQLFCTLAVPVETLELLLICRHVRSESAHSTTTGYRQLFLTRTRFPLLPVDLTCTNSVHGFGWVINSQLFRTVFCFFVYISRTFPLMYNLVFSWDQAVFHVYWF